MLAGLPGTTRTIDVHGVSTAVIEAGQQRARTAAAPRRHRMRGRDVGAGARPAGTRNTASSCPTCPGSASPLHFRDFDVRAFGEWLTGVVERTELERPTVVAHSLIGTLAARLAASGDPAIGRLVVYGAPGVGPYRMPLRLRYVAVRFAIRPSARNAERFDRFALLDLDATRGRDPEWYDAFVAYTQSRALEPATKKTMRRLIANRGQAHPGGRARPHRHSDHAVVGTPRPDGPARDRRSRRITTRLAFARHRRCSPRSAHRTTRRICGRTHVRRICLLSCNARRLRRGRAEPRHECSTHGRSSQSWSARVSRLRQAPSTRYVASGGTAAHGADRLTVCSLSARRRRSSEQTVARRSCARTVRAPGVRAILRPNRRSARPEPLDPSQLTRSHSTRSHSTRNRRTRSRCCPVRCSTRSVTRAAEKSSDHVADAIERVIHQVERAVDHVPRDVDHGRRRRSRRRQRHRHGQRRRDDRRDRRCGRVRGGGGQGVRRGQLSWGRTGCHRCGRGGGSRRDGRRWRGGRSSRQRRGTRRGRDRR